MSSVILNGDTSGSVTLTVPSVAGTNTVTVPSATGTVMVSGNMPAFSAINATYQTVSASTWTKVVLNTKTGTQGFDTNNYFDATTNYRFTPLIAGYYQINGIVSCGATVVNPTGGGVSIYKNGSGYINSSVQTATASNPSYSVSAIIYLNGSTDYVELYGIVYGGTGQAFNGSTNATLFSGALVRTA